MHQRVTVVVQLMVVLQLQSQAIAQKGAKAAEQVTRASCDRWVEQLANKSDRPFTDPYVLDPPRNVDRKALQVVKEAYENLALHFEIALPSLIKGLSDRRYSYYQEVPSNGSFICQEVGGACYEIISRRIEVYDGFLVQLDVTDVPRTPHFISSQGGVEKWFESRKTRSLLSLQLEAIDWALMQPKDKRIGADIDWTKKLATLRDFRTTLANSGKPYVRRIILQFEGK
jgi:hypothetical protein